MSKEREKRDSCQTEDMGFEAVEAYNLLRTNLTFSLPDEEHMLVGITSSIRGEGKSTTVSNLAYSLAKSGKKVGILELDMRLPSLAEHFKVEECPGVSNYLVGMASEEEIIRPSDVHENLFLIPAGDIPPNPSELLGMAKMTWFLQHLKEKYDCVLVDLPPVNLVSDTLIVTPHLDGIILVVRQNYSRKRELDEAIRQLDMAHARILGLVLNDSSSMEKKYRKKYGYQYGYQSKGGIADKMGLGKKKRK